MVFVYGSLLFFLDWWRLCLNLDFMGGGGGGESHTLKLYKEDEVECIEGADEISILKFCIAKYGNELIEENREKREYGDFGYEYTMKSMLAEADSIDSKDKLIALFNKIYYFITPRDKKELVEYEKQCEEEYDRLYESAEKLMVEVRGYNEKHRLFDYARKATTKDFQRSFEDIQAHIENAEDYEQIVALYKELTALIKDIVANYNHYRGDYFPYKINISTKILTPKQISKTKIQKSMEATFHETKLKDTKEIMDKLDLEYSYTPGKIDSVPKVITYKDKYRFSNKDLKTDREHIETNAFFIALLQAANLKVSAITKAYERAEATSGYLTQIESKYNERVNDLVTKRFNELYKKVEDNQYEFGLKLEKTQINFTIFRGNNKDEVLELDLQSEGFKWFFNLFFHLLYSKTLQKGSVVLMDEPAHNLSIPARKEFRDFLKQYGEENGITFVIVTHDPFLVHADYLDEIRIVQNHTKEDSKGVEILNDFSSISSKDTDALLIIKQALGIGTYILYPPNLQIIFVEGITDYNYLTTFKILKEREENKLCSVVFLPIGGLGEKGDEKEILEKLLQQHKEPILLIDDDGAGKAIIKVKEENKMESLRIIKLSEIDSKLKEIEDCFDKKDIEKYGLLKKDSNGKESKEFIKSSKLSSAIKKALLWRKADDDKTQNLIEQSTKQNFYKILDYLENL
ncbi:hypothetical protein CQA53_08040 [Helicobacter didelphidarum]|uniref:ATPase AAA-type core domain-containing protein n=1 Tax=Helicobacter didelphidarum TaxID=2040648 RepID=A0A3D8IGA1_9HELI|nr:AAA family ATPase [Helicobacter didelphidarum]RDU64025.1 hypothetical protein CQA53_08040 [Helicobacter didelphidarum]